MFFQQFLLYTLLCISLAYVQDKEEEEPKCIVGEWTTWSPCRAPRTFRHLFVEEEETVNEKKKGDKENEPGPPAPRPGNQASRKKRDLSHHIEKRHVVSGPSRRAKRQAEIAEGKVKTITAHSRMQKIEKMKLEQWGEVAKCRKEKSCPELNKRKSCGPIKCINGTAGGIYQCQNIDMLSLLSLEDLGYGDGDLVLGDDRVIVNDIWGWTDPLTEDEYVMVGLSGGTSFVRITNPLKPEVLGFLYTRSVPSNWRDIKVVNNTAYIVSEAEKHGMQVFDLTQLRNKTGFHVLSATAVYDEFSTAHNIVSNEDTGYVYVVGATSRTTIFVERGLMEPEPKEHGKEDCEGGLHIIDVIEPLNPRFVACFGEDGYSHDAQCVLYKGPHTKYVDREICFAYNEDTLTIVDLTDHMRPKMISRTEYRGAQYTHQGWLTEDHSVLLLDDELDELFNVYDTHTKTHIWDVSNLTNPVFKTTYESPVISIDHNQYVKGNYTWQSNYASGLQVHYIDQENFDLKPVAYFDILPSGDGARFLGTWSNYPFFKSGVVPVSSKQYGLFLLKPDYEAMAEESDRNNGLRDPNQGMQWRMRRILEADDDAECPGSEERRSCDMNEIEGTGTFLD